VLLSAQKLVAKFEQGNKFDAELLSMLETLTEEHGFSDQLKIWSRHSHGTEKLFQVVWKFTATTITFARRIQSHKDASVLVHGDIAA